MKSRITLENMEFYAFHGCYPEEQAVGNRFLVTVGYSCDASAAITSDEVSDTVSYLDVYRCVRREMEQPSHLLEHVADRILRSISQSFPAAAGIEVSISKLNPPLGGFVEKVTVSIVEKSK